MYVWEVGYHQDYRIALDFWSGLRDWITLLGPSDRVSDFKAYNGAVGKISSFRVNAVIRRGIVQLGNSFVSIFLFFPMKVAGENPRSSPLSLQPCINPASLPQQVMTNSTIRWSCKSVELKCMISCQKTKTKLESSQNVKKYLQSVFRNHLAFWISIIGRFRNTFTAKRQTSLLANFNLFYPKK